MGKEIRIKCLKGEGKGSVDVLPVNLFRDLATRSTMAHLVELSGGGSDFAKFTATIQPRTVTLDYHLHRGFNVRRGMLLGTLDLEFTDDSRTKVRAVTWNGQSQGPGEAAFGTVQIGKAVPLHLRLTAAVGAKGAGFGTPRQNARVEKAAVKVARARLGADGWTVRSVEAEKCGYDLECIKGKESLHVEAKGHSGQERLVHPNQR